MSKLLQRLRDPSRSGVYRAARDEALVEAARAGRLDLVEIEAAEATLFADLARDLRLPDWFGANWDALADCLGDLSWREAPGHVLLLRRYPAGKALAMLLDVLRSSAEYWAGRGTPFFAVLLDPQRNLPLPELYRET